MLKKNFPFLASFLIAANLFAVEQLDEKYLVSFGKKDGALKIVEYISFSCHNCVNLFREHFKEIKDEYIDSGLVYWIFHPVPLDFLTIQAIHCLEKLNETEKKIFFESVFEEIDIDEPEGSPFLIKAAMEALGKPIPNLLEKEYLKETKAFEDAFQFVKNNQELNAVPALSFNGKLSPFLVPDEEFLETLDQIFEGEL